MGAETVVGEVTMADVVIGADVAAGGAEDVVGGGGVESTRPGRRRSQAALRMGGRGAAVTVVPACA